MSVTPLSVTPFVVLAIRPGPENDVAIVTPAGEQLQSKMVDAEDLDVYLDELIRMVNRSGVELRVVVVESQPRQGPLAGADLEEAYSRRVVARALEVYELLPAWAPIGSSVAEAASWALTRAPR